MKILFICTGNAARSQMGEAFYNTISNSHDAASAGTEAIVGKPMPEFVVTAMNEVGVDVSQFVRKQITPEMVNTASRIILITRQSLPDYVQNSDKVEHWDIPDPQGMDLDAVRSARDAVRANVEDLVSRIDVSHE